MNHISFISVSIRRSLCGIIRHICGYFYKTPDHLRPISAPGSGQSFPCHLCCFDYHPCGSSGSSRIKEGEKKEEKRIITLAIIGALLPLPRQLFSILLLCVLLPQIWYDNYVAVLVTPELCSQGLLQTALFFLPQFGTRDSRYVERVRQASRRCSASETMCLFPWPNFAAFRPQFLSLGRISKLFHFFQSQEERWSMTGARTAPFNSWGARRNARCTSPGHLTVKVTESWNLF